MALSENFGIYIKECNPVGCVPPTVVDLLGVRVTGNPHTGQRPLGQRSSKTETPWTEIPRDRDTPRQRYPQTETSWTETHLDRDPAWTETPSTGQKSPSPCEKTNTSENITLPICRMWLTIHR